MSVCLLVDSSSFITVSSSGLSCDFYGLSASEYAQFQAVTGVAMPTSEEILFVYSWGMGAVLLPFALAYAVKVAVMAIKKL